MGCCHSADRGIAFTERRCRWFKVEGRGQHRSGWRARWNLRPLAVLRDDRDLLEESARAFLERETLMEGDLVRLTERLKPAA